MTLPLLLSVPHAGLRIPPEVEDLCILTPDQVAADGDVGAAELYLSLEGNVADLVATGVARAIVDLNRAEDDRSKDGVVKTHTCWDVPVYRESLTENVIEELLRRYYRPYHQWLTNLPVGLGHSILLAIDCHTMAAAAPPVAPDPGQRRPFVCLGNAGFSCPAEWMDGLANRFRKHFDGEVTVNDPFRGGYITRMHAAERPWVQLEITRSTAMSWPEKRRRILAALGDWVLDMDRIRR